MKFATLSTRDLQEQCHKFYVASYRATKGIGDLTNVFLKTTTMKVIYESFLQWMILNIRYKPNKSKTTLAFCLFLAF